LARCCADFKTLYKHGVPREKNVDRPGVYGGPRLFQASRVGVLDFAALTLIEKVPAGKPRASGIKRSLLSLIDVHTVMKKYSQRMPP
jgi:hypothetical protein